MKELQFATPAAMKAETPKGIKTIYRLLMFLSTVWGSAAAAHLIHLPAEMLVEIAGWLAFGNFAVYNFCQMFGYAAPKDDEVHGNVN